MISRRDFLTTSTAAGLATGALAGVAMTACASADSA
ncbi:MAG: hypothetical protein DME01_10010 [Candidatus Rokuibacteriota bacterium]|nr:MAG: hypothetical protein DME01_10010 [Candidatus Rokubacteria bacterium]